MATITWRGGASGDWSAQLNWSGFVVPGATDDVVISTATVTVDGSFATAGVDLTGGAVLDVTGTLALGGVLQGPVVVAGTLVGGTVEGQVTLEGTGTLIDVTQIPVVGGPTLTPETAAGEPQPIVVTAELTLLQGLYPTETFALDAAGMPAVEFGPGVVTLGPAATVTLSETTSGRGSPPAAGAFFYGTLVNQGLITGSFGAGDLTFADGSFTNSGTVNLTPITLEQSTSYVANFQHLTLFWEQTFGPTLDATTGQFSNAGLLAMTGGTLLLNAPTVGNQGRILLTDAPSQLGIVNSNTAFVVDTLLSTEIVVGSGVTSFANSGTLSADTVEFLGSVALAGLGSIAAAQQLAFAGALDLGGGTLDASRFGSVFIEGAVKDGVLQPGSGTLFVEGATLDDVTLLPGAHVTGPITLVDPPAGTTALTLDTVTTELAYSAGASIAGVAITSVGTADTLALLGGTVTLGATSSFTLAAGTFDAIGPGALEVDGSLVISDGFFGFTGTLVGTGHASVAPGATLGASSLAGALSITVGPNAVLGAAALGGSPNITLDAGASATFDALSGSPTIDFAGGPALLVLPDTGRLAVTLQNLGPGDLVDFTAVSSKPNGIFGNGAATVGGGLLLVTGASGDTASAPVQNPSPNLSFMVTNDLVGGTLVTVACFREGTHIATARGPVPVERLRRGELVRTAAGRLRPAIWIGRRRVVCRRQARPEAVWPVRIAAHAFGPGRPARDLWLSPDHAVAFRGALIPVRYLINGATIVQEPAEEVCYWHVELPAHELVLAEHLPVESYLDTGNRAGFERSGTRAAPVPAAALRVWRARGCAPLVAAGPRLAAARAALLRRARQIGHCLTEAPDLRVLADGKALARRRDGSFRLPRGTRAVRLCSRSFVPADLAGPGGDPRRLGVAVGSLRLDGAPLPLDDARLGAGWYAPEPAWRWTEGEAEIAAAGARALEIGLAITGRYWLHA